MGRSGYRDEGRWRSRRGHSIPRTSVGRRCALEGLILKQQNRAWGFSRAERCFPVLLFGSNSPCSSLRSRTARWLHKSILWRGEALSISSGPGFGMVPTQRQISFLFCGSWADSGPSSGAPCFRMVINLYLSTFCVWYPQLHSLSVESLTPGLQGLCILPLLRSALLWLPSILGPPHTPPPVCSICFSVTSFSVLPASLSYSL